MTVSHRGEDDSRLMLQINVRTVSFLQDTLVEVVPVMNVQIPTTDFRNRHVVTAQLRRLHVPDDVLAVAILVADLDHGSRHSVDALAINVQAIPGVSELDHGIGFEDLLEEYTLDRDPQVYQIQRRRDDFRIQLQLLRAGGAKERIQ